MLRSLSTTNDVTGTRWFTLKSLYSRHSEASSGGEWCLKVRMREKDLIKEMICHNSLDELEKMALASGSRFHGRAVRIVRRAQDRDRGEGIGSDDFVQQCDDNPDDKITEELLKEAERRKDGDKTSAKTRKQNAEDRSAVLKLLRENTLEELKDLYDNQDEDQPGNHVLRKAFRKKKKEAGEDTMSLTPSRFSVFRKDETALWWWNSFDHDELKQLHQCDRKHPLIKLAYHEATRAQGWAIAENEDEDEEEVTAPPVNTFSNALRDLSFGSGGDQEDRPLEAEPLVAPKSGLAGRDSEVPWLEHESFETLKRGTTMNLKIIGTPQHTTTA